MPILADHVPTQPPYDQSLSLDSTTGDLTVGIYTSDGFEDSPPEKYTIFFALDGNVTTSSYCVSTSFGHTGNLQWNNYVFKLDDLRTFFELPVGTFAIRIRSDNDTDNSYSTLTSQISVTLPNQTPFSDTQSSWSAPSSTCNDTSTTTTTTSTTTSSTTTTTSSTTTTTSSTTSTTTTTTLPPPPPTTTTTTLAPVIVNIGGEEVEYTQKEVDDGTVQRDIERQENKDKYGCYMTNAQIERGDCDIKEEPKEEIKEEPKEEIVEEEKKEEVIIVEDEPKETDTKEELPDDDVVVPEVVVKDEVKDIEEVKEEIKEVIEDIVIEEEVVEIPEEIIIVEPEEKVKDELDKEIPGDDNIREEPIQEEDEVTDNKEPEEIIKKIEEVVVEELETEQVIEVLEEIVDVGVENLELASKDVLEVVSEVVQKSVTQEQPLTEEQTEVVAEVFNLEKKEDVAIVQEAVKNDEAVAEAVEVFVQKAIENKDVEDYTLADVVVEVQVEEFLSDPIGSFTDIQIEDIDLSAIGNDMTDDQKEKAQEVVVPVIIASQIVASVQVVPVRIRRRI